MSMLEQCIQVNGDDKVEFMRNLLKVKWEKTFPAYKSINKTTSRTDAVIPGAKTISGDDLLTNEQLCEMKGGKVQKGISEGSFNGSKVCHFQVGKFISQEFLINDRDGIKKFKMPIQ